MSEAAIRPAVPADADAVLRVVRDAYAPWVARLGRESSPTKWDYAALIADGPWTVWVLEVEQGVIGVLVLEAGAEALLVHNVAVASAAQKLGHGRRLLAFAEAEAKRRGYREVRLFVNALMTENVALYEHLRFRETRRIEGDEPDRVYVLMTKPVAGKRGRR